MSGYTEVKSTTSTANTSSVKSYTIPASPSNNMEVDSAEFRNLVAARDKAIIEFMSICGFDDCKPVNDENGFMTDIVVDGKYTLAVRHSNAYVLIANSRVALGKTSDGVQFQKSQLSKGKPIKVKSHSRNINMIVSIAKKDYNRNKQYNDFKLSVEAIDLPGEFKNPMTGDMPMVSTPELGVVSLNWSNEEHRSLELQVNINGGVSVIQPPIEVNGLYTPSDIDTLDNISDQVGGYIGWIRTRVEELKPIVSNLK